MGRVVVGGVVISEALVGGSNGGCSGNRSMWCSSSRCSCRLVVGGVVVLCEEVGVGGDRSSNIGVVGVGL